MAFTKHLFISYTHRDNEKLAGQEKGWVSRLHENLQNLIPMRLGEEVVIWRDNKLSGNDEFGDEIFTQLAEVATIVCVLSPKYLNSKWCRDEATAFCRISESTAGTRVGNKSRIFKVMKLPVSNRPEGLPEEFGKLTGFPFYKSKDDTPLELDPAYGTEMLAEFNEKSAMLAQKLADTLRALCQAHYGPEEGTEKKGTIFLAATSWDRDLDRKRLEAELSGRGYAVLPDHDLPQNEDTCCNEIRKILADCDLAIHIIGNFPAVVPSGPRQKSLDVLQNELAVVAAEDRGTPRLIWMPDDSQSKVPSHQEFLNLLESDTSVQRGADVVKGGVEVFKGAVLQSLQKLEQKKRNPPSQADITISAGKLIYVICEKRDNKASVDFRTALTNRGYEPRRPIFDGDAATVRQHDDFMLAQCGLVVLFWGAGDKSWYDNTRVEIEKAKSRARVWTCLAPPVTSQKQLLLDKLEGGPILNGMTGAVAEAEVDRMLSDTQGSAAAGEQS